MSNGIPPTVRAFIAGMSGAGKSTLAWKMYLQRFPRRLVVDLTGEWQGQADMRVWDVEGFGEALRALAPRGRWTITVGIGLEELPELVDYLFPIPDLEDSPIRLCGGAALLMDEVDLVAPPRSVTQEVRTLWRRSRHIGLSVIATTQRPEAVSREVSSQSHHAICLHLVEPAALVYMRELMQVDLAPLEAWTREHPHGGLWKDLRAGRCWWLTESGRLVAPAREEEAQPLASGSVGVSEGRPAGLEPVEE